MLREYCEVCSNVSLLVSFGFGARAFAVFLIPTRYNFPSYFLRTRVYYVIVSSALV